MGNFFPNLTVALIVLKLIGEIDWSWMAVTSPYWGMFIVMVAVKWSEASGRR